MNIYSCIGHFDVVAVTASLFIAFRISGCSYTDSIFLNFRIGTSESHACSDAQEQITRHQGPGWCPQAPLPSAALKKSRLRSIAGAVRTVWR